MLKRILAVDDDLCILDALVELLQFSGYDVTTTLRGDDVFKKIDECVPDLILLDIMIAGIDGRQICKNIKANLKTMQIPVIMLSATPQISDSARKSGADDFLAKPFDIIQLLSKIEHQLQIH